eukprot:TRINITY_DN104208_c0_g1_i1.p1 TRINITY_DN104208_c0_g1~~TRINITY_DN104208_c0_g1_i1.p1  ORF type:complete len:388 (+),score=13.85 TRINITY_DN104208_c0_g1_i1:57-1220(+)
MSVEGKEEENKVIRGSIATIRGCLEHTAKFLRDKQLSAISARERWANARDFVHESLNTYDIGEDSENILHLDVGGTEIHTCQATFQTDRASDSMLEAWLSGNYPWCIEEEEDGLTLIDRDGELFQCLLAWLREGTDHLLFADKSAHSLICNMIIHDRMDWVRSLRREATYFGLDSLLTWCNRALRRTVTLVSGVLTHKSFVKSKGFDMNHPDLLVDVENQVYSVPASEGDNYCFLDMVGLLIPTAARTGCTEFSIRILSDTAEGRAGFTCNCGIKPNGPIITSIMNEHAEVSSYTVVDCPTGWDRTLCGSWGGQKGDVIVVWLGKWKDWKFPGVLVMKDRKVLLAEVPYYSRQPRGDYTYVPTMCLIKGRVSVHWGSRVGTKTEGKS